MKKGFVHTLESVIAVMIIISFIVFIMPSLSSNESDFNKQLYYTLNSLDERGLLKSFVYERNISGLYNTISNELDTIKGISGFLVLVEYYNFSIFNSNASLTFSNTNRTRMTATTLINMSEDIDNEIVYNSTLSSAGFSGTYTSISSAVSGNTVNITINSTYYPYTFLLRELYVYGTEDSSALYKRINYALGGHINISDTEFIPALVSIKYY